MGNRALLIRVWVCLGIHLVVSGCATPSVKSIRFGDTQARLVRVLGKPTEVGKDDLGRVTWLYLGLIEGDCELTLWDGKLVRAPRCPEDVGNLTMELKERRNQDYRPRVWGGAIEESSAKRSLAKAEATSSASSTSTASSSSASILPSDSSSSMAATMAATAAANAAMAGAAAAASAAAMAGQAAMMAAPPPMAH